MRSLATVLVLTGGSLYAVDGDVYPPHGNPLVYTLAVSWLISFVIAMTSIAFLQSLSPRVFAPASWEKDGDIYNGAGVQAFRWVLFHSPLGWINPNLHMSAGQADCDRLLKEMNTAEGVHWLTCAASVALALWWLAGDRDAYGYSMLLVNIPFNLYPIMLQRWNRGRVFRMLKRRQLPAPV